MADKDKIVLGIHTILDPNNQGQGSSAELTDGHAWITVTRNGKTEYYGLWPDNHPTRSLDNGPASDIRKGIESEPIFNPPTASRYVELTPDQAKKLEEALKENVEWGYTNTCASWASKTYSNVTGQSIDASEYLITDTPRELTKSINALEKKLPTSIDKPSPPIESKKSSWNLFGENTINNDVKNVYDKLYEGLAPQLAEKGAEKWTVPMLAEMTHECIKKGINSDKIAHMGINEEKNTIYVVANNKRDFAAVDAIEASKANPNERLQEANQLHGDLEQKELDRQLQLAQQQERGGRGFG
ncbi:hypothetical protein [Neisseria sp. Ec49-e6-T10]|uniref:hypothetical protein n=1 Tax=Neisseria sp. Ec49-e6-T10 TaxID=3140744 RepID=UPI003EBA8530